MEIKHENIIFPDYSESIVNLSSSILNHFGVKPTHNTIPMVDQILARGYKHVVVVLLDGLGMNILESNLNYRDFLRRKTKKCESAFRPIRTFFLVPPDCPRRKPMLSRKITGAES